MCSSFALAVISAHVTYFYTQFCLKSGGLSPPPDFELGGSIPPIPPDSDATAYAQCITLHCNHKVLNRISVKTLFFSCNFALCRHFWWVIFMSCIFMSCNFMSCNFMSCNFDGPWFSRPARWVYTVYRIPWHLLRRHTMLTTWSGLLTILDIRRWRKLLNYILLVRNSNNFIV